jgi:hypothetical protein
MDHIKLFESWSDEDEKEYQLYSEKFQKFSKELEKLSKKYGIVISSTGGVQYGEVDDISYSSDLSSGDLENNVKWKK